MAALMGALEDESSEVRCLAVSGLRDTGSSEVIERLELALRDPDERVRYAAAQALKKIRGEEPPK